MDGVYRALTADWSSADGTRAHVAVGPIRGALLLNDLRTPPGERPPPPPFDLDSVRRRCTPPPARRRAKTVWSNLGTERGLASFWPHLPAGVAAGSRASFVLAWEPSGTVRGTLPALDAWSATPLPDPAGSENRHAVLATYRLRVETAGLVVTSMRSAVSEDAPPILRIDEQGLSTSATTDPAPR